MDTTLIQDRSINPCINNPILVKCKCMLISFYERLSLNLNTLNYLWSPVVWIYIIILLKVPIFFQLQDIYIYFFIIFFHRYIFICSTTIPVLTVNWHWMIDSHLITEVKQLSPVSTWIWVHLATLGTVSEKSGIKLVGYGASYFIP